jgi:hypothetical protein
VDHGELNRAKKFDMKVLLWKDGRADQNHFLLVMALQDTNVSEETLNRPAYSPEKETDSLLHVSISKPPTVYRIIKLKLRQFR